MHQEQPNRLTDPATEYSVPQSNPELPPFWSYDLDERTLKQINFCRDYARHYSHGAPDHLSMCTIAELAARLDKYYSLLVEASAFQHGTNLNSRL